jgi:broad specificity phosphatase PhoE
MWWHHLGEDHSALEILMPVPKKEFLYLRHGQTDWNLQGRLQGHSDVPLNETGLSQANVAAEQLSGQGVELVISSPLIRALKTAAIVAEHIQRPIRVDSRLMERTFGSFEGLVINDVKRKLGLRPNEWLTAHLPADAEQWHETCARAASAIGAWLNRHPSERLLFVAHSGLFDALHQQMFGTRLEAKHEAYLFSPTDGGWNVREVRSS